MKNFFNILKNHIRYSISENIKNKCANIEVMLFDVDGILTSGDLIYDYTGEKYKIFNVLDGYGIINLIKHGIHVGFISGRNSKAVSKRANELGVKILEQGINNKAEYLDFLSNNMNINLDKFGFMGDDIIDIVAMKKVAFSATVPNSPEYVKNIALWVSKNNGGKGAVRECCDLILDSKNLLKNIINN
ncbi:3-deoxy-D-manno-octulosonate 8-phosphate phosphatase KdsC [Candidatus Kinetoplastibacterium sorsogonicusi]|uniref:3-deoxy-D-manno-octulosonate 8-phosphate phosphatase KdsC n=1 Tax=Candidatus Kinetoplastidibacterium kentomonadis TaxID=1576550 RepID=A0A3S7JAN3_9PROT|nr:HAD hydrolase family protein [Candidatus Kinetoplastibacterium sorsogonicusi]AWD32726.1 3-deoxy-D-manno-octulosonate 8-phosphate phosphatase KdsC [Candidatus Kinetoplastibacterium sorsogonicusi]